MGNSYSDTSINLGSGSGTVGGGTPRVPSAGGGGGANRHCAAWEQVRAALYTIADCMDMMGCAGGAAVRAYADESKMERNRGE